MSRWSDWAPWEAPLCMRWLVGVNALSALIVLNRRTAPVQGISEDQAKEWAKGTPANWAQETFAIARDHAYGELPTPDGRVRFHLTNDYLERLEAALPGLADQSADRRLLLPDAPFLRAIHVWGASDRAWSRGDEASMVDAGDRAGIDAAFLARVEACVVPADPLVVVYSSGSTA